MINVCTPDLINIGSDAVNVALNEIIISTPPEQIWIRGTHNLRSRLGFVSFSFGLLNFSFMGLEGQQAQ